MNINQQLVKALRYFDYKKLDLFGESISSLHVSVNGMRKVIEGEPVRVYSRVSDTDPSNVSCYIHHNEGRLKSSVKRLLAHEGEESVDIRLFNALYMSLVHAGGVEVAVELFDRYRDRLDIVAPDDKHSGYLKQLIDFTIFVKYSDQINIFGKKRIQLEPYMPSSKPQRDQRFNNQEIVDLVVDAIDRFMHKDFQLRMPLLGYDICRFDKIEAMKKLKVQLYSLNLLCFNVGHFSQSSIALFHSLDEDHFMHYWKSCREILGLGYNGHEVESCLKKINYNYALGSQQDARFMAFMLLWRRMHYDDGSLRVSRRDLNEIFALEFGENPSAKSAYTLEQALKFLIDAHAGAHFPCNRVKDIFRRHYHFFMQEFGYNNYSDEFAFVHPEANYFYVSGSPDIALNMADLTRSVDLVFSTFKKKSGGKTIPVLMDIFEIIKDKNDGFIRDLMGISIKHHKQLSALSIKTQEQHIYKKLNKMSDDYFNFKDRYRGFFCLSVLLFKATALLSDDLDADQRKEDVVSRIDPEKIEEVYETISKWGNEFNRLSESISGRMRQLEYVPKIFGSKDRYNNLAFIVSNGFLFKSMLAEIDIRAFMDSREFKEVTEKALSYDVGDHDLNSIDSVL